MVNFYTPPKKSLSSQSVTVTVHTLDAFGQGVANLNGKTIFVKAALPNETVDIILTEEKKNYAKAKVVRYHTRSPERMQPQCDYYQVCGGCDMQHISPHLQHQAKYNALINLLQKETNSSLREITGSTPHIVASSPYHYRRRARLAIYWIKNELSIGFRKASSNQIINIERCPVLVPQLDALLIPLQHCLRDIRQKKALGHIELIAVESGVMAILRHTTPLAEQDINRLKQFAEQQKIAFYLQGDTLVPLVGQTDPYYTIDQFKLTFSPLDFIQVNSEINHKMVATALEWLDLKPTDNVLDLFCGMGNFSLPIAAHCKSVTGIEGVTTLVAKAQLNATLNQKLICAKTNFITCNLDDNQQFSTWHNLLRQDQSGHHQKRMPLINKVLLDPSRTGAFTVINALIKALPARIVYISCNPATLARDSKLLIDAGYKITRLAMLDMFPQTKHVESMLLFIK
ncbi:23S rRNA (uracil(1939)-C(5))-methyltransferase RlmD [Orbaceae bacterium ESL0727]|nr:23S rRNA (uracil(1939)-C(5))-methyltransferase RlmD [Orbaceae bacterium ESL0727]